jgi:hypothetical protein
MEKNENHFHCCQVVMFDTLRNCFVLTSNSLFQCKFEIFLKILKFFSNSYFCNLLQFSLRLPNIYWIDSVTNNRAQVKIMIKGLDAILIYLGDLCPLQLETSSSSSWRPTERGSLKPLWFWIYWKGIQNSYVVMFLMMLE